MPLTAFCDGRLLGERRGARPQVLALHGWGRSRRDFAPLLERFEGVAVDLPGFGATPPPDRPWGSADYADALAPLLPLFGEPAVVVGHSFGGRVAVQLGARHPGAVRALVLTGVPLVPAATHRRRPSRRYRALRALHRAGMIGEGRMEQIRHRYGSVDYRAASGVMRQVLVRVVNESYEEQLARLGIPVELVWAEGDDEVPVAVARRAADHLADARLTVRPGGDHFSCLGDPALAAAVARHYR